MLIVKEIRFAFPLGILGVLKENPLRLRIIPYHASNLVGREILPNDCPNQLQSKVPYKTAKKNPFTA